MAPSEFKLSSTASHLDEDADPSRSPNSLMSPMASSGTAVHDPGPIVLAMLYDMGWELKERTVDLLDVLKCLEGR